MTWPIRLDSIISSQLCIVIQPHTPLLLQGPIVILPLFRHVLPAVHQRDQHVLQPVPVPESSGHVPANATSTTATNVPAEAAAAVPTAAVPAAVQLPAGLQAAASWLPAAKHVPAAAAAVPAASSAGGRPKRRS